ncbi:hypothetical protein C8A05DRAFT_18943, partial [Staphylotrichum tortipilum]
SGTSPLIKLSTSTRQPPALAIQILPSAEACRNSSAVVPSENGGGSATVRVLDNVTTRLGVFPATLMLPKPMETVGMAGPSKSGSWN